MMHLQPGKCVTESSAIYITDKVISAVYTETMGNKQNCFHLLI